jgi:hypothetical protein
MKIAIRHSVLTLVAGCACAFGVSAAENPSTADAPASPAMKVAVDRETGRFRAPTAEELQALREQDRALARAKASGRKGPPQPQLPKTAAEAEATTVYHADGSVSMSVPEELMSELVAEVRTDGRIEIAHGKIATTSSTEATDE